MSSNSFETRAALDAWGASVAALPRRLRILQVGKFYHPHKGGIETYLQDLCEHLRDRVDMRVVVAADGRRTEFEVINGVPVLRLATLLTVSSAPVSWGLARIIQQSAADLVHIHTPHPVALLAYLSQMRHGAFVISHHSDIVRQRVLGKLFQPIQDAALKRCDAVIVSSPNYLESSSVLVAQRKKCHIIPYGVRLRRFDDYDRELSAAIRARYGERVILSIGRLVYYKGFDFLIRAMRHVNGQLLIIGAGPWAGKLMRLARECDVAARVHFLGEVEDPVPYYHAADVFALASTARSEAFGIVQIEAMACGKPVINTNLDSGVPFVSRHAETGLTVPPADSVALAAALNTLLNNDVLRRDFGRAARRRVEREFTSALMAQRTLQLYEEVIARQKNKFNLEAFKN
jgi:glycosyltransferase involved in cell wall biosynthesis